MLLLPEIGTRGASHILMQDRNGLEVVDRLAAWINDRVGQGP